MAKERWRGVPGVNLYEASDLGRIRKILSAEYGHPVAWRYLRLTRTAAGYLTTHLSGSLPDYLRVLTRRPGLGRHTVSVARLVAAAWHPLPDNPHAVVGYLDGDPCNVSATNVFWYVRQASNRSARWRSRQNAPPPPEEGITNYE